MSIPARSRKFPAQPSARLGAYLAAGLGASTIGTAQSAIVFFDVNPAKTIGAGTPTPNQTVSFTDINIGAGTYSSSIGYGPPTVSGHSLWFTITGENQFTAEGAGGLALSSVFTGFSSPDNLRSFSAGQEIGTGIKYATTPIAGWKEWQRDRLCRIKVRHPRSFEFRLAGARLCREWSLHHAHRRRLRFRRPTRRGHRRRGRSLSHPRTRHVGGPRSVRRRGGFRALAQTPR